MNKVKIITNIMLSLLGIGAITSTAILATNDNIKELEPKTSLLSNNIKRANEKNHLELLNKEPIHLNDNGGGDYYKDEIGESHCEDISIEPYYIWGLDPDLEMYMSGEFYFLLVYSGNADSCRINTLNNVEELNYEDFIYSSDAEDLISNLEVWSFMKPNTHDANWWFSVDQSDTQESHVYSASFDVYVFREDIGEDCYNYYAGDVIEVDGDYFLDSLTIDKRSSTEVYYNAEYGTYAGDKSIVNFINNLDEPVLVGINATNGYLDEMGFSLYEKILLPNELMIIEDKIINTSNISCEYVGYIDPSTSQPTFEFSLTAPLDQSDSPEINSISFFKLVERDIQGPTISGENHFVVNVNNPLSKEEILSHITAYDETDGKVDVVFDSCDYDPSNLTLGQFDAVVSATDKSGNKATVNITINVVDIDKPVINGTNSYEVSYDEPITLDSIKEALNVTDNFEKNLVLDLVEDNYTGHEREVGEHTIIFNAKDSSDNVSDNYTVTIKVVDKKLPIITAPKTITAGNDKMVSLDEIKAKISVNDALDGNIENYEISGFENYETNYKKVGNYVLTVKASDKSGNNATFEITITVEDRIAPDIYFDDYFIVVPQGQELSKEQIYEMASKVLNIAVTEFSSLEGEYDTSVAGTYKLTLKTINNDSYNFTLSVEANYEDTTEYRDLAWYEYIYIWFSIFFNFQDGYETESFWDFSTRCSYISEVYSSGKIKITEKVNDEVVSNVEALPNDEESIN